MKQVKVIEIEYNSLNNWEITTHDANFDEILSELMREKGIEEGLAKQLRASVVASITENLASVLDHLLGDEDD